MWGGGRGEESFTSNFDLHGPPKLAGEVLRQSQHSDSVEFTRLEAINGELSSTAADCLTVLFSLEQLVVDHIAGVDVRYAPRDCDAAWPRHNHS